MRERSKSGVGLDGGRRFAGKGKKKVVKHSAQIKMSVRSTQFICVRFIKGDCSH